MKCEILLQLNWYENSPTAGSSPGVYVHSRCFTLTGSGIGTSSMRNPEAGPNSAQRSDFIPLVLIALQSRLKRHASSARGVEHLAGQFEILSNLVVHAFV
jgi:hypothetical protein